MAGNWTTAPGPLEPGSFINTITTGSTTATGQFGTVAMPFTADWGPVNTMTTLTSENALISTFGPYQGATASAHPTATSFLAREVFVGGASQLLAYRIADGTQAQASILVPDATHTTGSMAITVKAKYPGIRGNNFKITVALNTDTTKTDVKVFDNNLLVETWTYLKTSHAALKAAVEDPVTGSRYIAVPTITIDGSALTPGTYTLAGGVSGSTPNNASYVAAFTAFQAHGGFDIMVLDGNTASDVQLSFQGWVASMNAEGLYLEGVMGGPLNESLASQVSRTLGYNSEFIVSVGGGDYAVVRWDGVMADDPNGSSANPPAYSSAWIAPRIAGHIAAAGITRSVTRDIVSDVVPVVPLFKADIETLLKGGVLTLKKRGSDTIIVEDKTSYTTVTTAKDATFSQLVNVRAMQKIAADIDDEFERNWIGKKFNNDAVQKAIVAKLQAYFSPLEGQGVLKPGTLVEIDTRYDNSGSTVYVLITARFGDELKQVRMTFVAPSN